MCEYDKFVSILNRSKEFSFEDGTILVLRDYHTGEKIKIDLSQLDEEAFEEMLVRDEEDDEDE